MFTRCLSYGVLYVVSLIAVFTVFSSSAGAWSGVPSYESCGYTISKEEAIARYNAEPLVTMSAKISDTSIYTSWLLLREDEVGREQTWTLWLGTDEHPIYLRRYNPSAPIWVLGAWSYGNDGTTSMAWIRDEDMPDRGDTNPWTTQWTYNNTARRVTGSPGYVDMNNPDGCIGTSGGIIAWDGETNTAIEGIDIEGWIPAGEGEAEPDEPCGAWDAACFMGKVIGTIADTFQGLFDGMKNMFTALGEFIGGIFINEEGVNIFGQFWSNIFTGMHEKLGFLTFPFDFMAGLLGSTYGGGISTCSGGGNFMPQWCSWNFGFIFNSELKIDFGLLERNLPSLWNIGKWSARAGLTLSMIFIVHRKYFETVEA